MIAQKLRPTWKIPGDPTVLWQLPPHSSRWKQHVAGSNPKCRHHTSFGSGINRNARDWSYLWCWDSLSLCWQVVCCHLSSSVFPKPPYLSLKPQWHITIPAACPLSSFIFTFSLPTPLTIKPVCQSDITTYCVTALSLHSHLKQSYNLDGDQRRVIYYSVTTALSQRPLCCCFLGAAVISRINTN